MDINAASSENAFIEKGNQPTTYQHFPNVTQKKLFHQKIINSQILFKNFQLKPSFFYVCIKKKMQSLQVEL